MVIAAKGTCSSLQVLIKFCYFTRTPQLAVFMGANGVIVTVITYVVFYDRQISGSDKTLRRGKSQQGEICTASSAIILVTLWSLVN